MPANKSLHLLAVVLGIVGGIMALIAVVLALGFAVPSQVDNITQTESELYAALAIGGAVAAEFGAREV